MKHSHSPVKLGSKGGVYLTGIGRRHITSSMLLDSFFVGTRGCGKVKWKANFALYQGINLASDQCEFNSHF